jgi:hypothetical protein
MNLYVIHIAQAGGREGILSKKGETLYFDSDEKAREYANKNVTFESILALIGWKIMSRKSAKESGYEIKEPNIINPK